MEDNTSKSYGTFEFSLNEEALEEGYGLTSAEIMLPQNYTKLDNEKHIASMEKLIDALEELDDVQTVYHNWDPRRGIRHKIKNRNGRFGG